jgi:ankyrin repeat protein
MEECVKLGVNLNLVDTQRAAPIHLALRKRQYAALEDIIKLNQKKEIIDINIADKNGNSALHYACEKQDSELFMILLSSPHLNNLF